MSFQKVSQTICSLLLIGMLLGCQPDGRSVDSKSETNSTAPRHGLKLHKPKNLATAVDRLVEINEALQSGEPFPPPLKIEYVEVIHGTGPGAHSHFYSASSYDANAKTEDHGHHDHHEEEAVERRVAEIPLQTELKDIVKWLPDIAAKANTSEAEWTTVSDAAKSLTKVIEGIGSDASDADYRDAWKKQTKTIEPLLATLKTLTEKLVGATK